MRTREIEKFVKSNSLCVGCLWQDKICPIWSDGFLNSEDADKFKERGFKFEVIVIKCPILQGDENPLGGLLKKCV